MPTKTKPTQVKIVIVDDHPLLRQGLAQLIDQENDLNAVGEASDASEAMLVVAKTKPDLLIIDISLKGLSGIELTKNVLAEYPKMLVLIISMYDETLYVERVLRAGARGYLMKQEASSNVITAIRTVLDGKIYVSDKWRETLVNQFVGGSKATAGPSTERLSGRELEILQIIGQGFSTRKIAEELHVSIKTVESHYANIKEKLDLKNSHELIQFATRFNISES